MTKPTAATPADPSPGLLTRARRRASSVLALSVALGAVGFGYAALTPTSAAADQTQSVDVQRGQQLYDNACITCHGRNLQGVTDRGPSLIGVGEAATYFQVATGRMPATAQGPQNPAKPVHYTEAEVNDLAAYVQSVGGGPEVPSGDLRSGDMALGGELFRLNCAQCHNFAGKGGALSSGKSAPGLEQATDKVIYAAMLSGPENMPVFGDNTLSPAEKRAIINYVQSLKETKDPGGIGIGRLGPVSETLVLWIAGVGALMFGVLWIGAKS